MFGVLPGPVVWSCCCCCCLCQMYLFRFCQMYMLLVLYPVTYLPLFCYNILTYLPLFCYAPCLCIWSCHLYLCKVIALLLSCHLFTVSGPAQLCTALYHSCISLVLFLSPVHLLLSTVLCPRPWSCVDHLAQYS